MGLVTRLVSMQPVLPALPPAGRRTPAHGMAWGLCDFVKMWDLLSKTNFEPRPIIHGKDKVYASVGIASQRKPDATFMRIEVVLRDSEPKPRLYRSEHPIDNLPDARYVYFEVLMNEQGQTSYRRLGEGDERAIKCFPPPKPY